MLPSHSFKLNLVVRMHESVPSIDIFIRHFSIIVMNDEGDALREAIRIWRETTKRRDDEH